MSLLTEPSNPLPLRDYQQVAIENLRNSLRAGHRRPCLQAPTGAGKTRVAGEIFRLAREKGHRVVFTVPRIDLIDQTLRSFWRDGIGDIGVIQADHIETDWSRPVQVASVQTLQKRGYPAADLVIVDEAHTVFKFITEWVAHPEWQKVPFIGLSATPWTKGLGRIYDDLIVVATTAQMIDQGFLSDFRVFAPTHPDLTGVKVVAGDYHEGQLSDAMNKTQLVGDVVQTWQLRAEGRPTLVFAVDRAHAKALQKRFEEAGIAAGYQDAYTQKEEREQIRRNFENGRYQVVCSVATLTMGVDWDVRCISLVRPTRSRILYTQIVGRGLRTAPGKDHCIILDHSDNTLRLGFVTDIHQERLDTGDKKAAEERSTPLPKECSQCAFLMLARVRECPNCGHVRKAPISNIEPGEGQLVELKRHGRGTLPSSASEIQIMQRKIPLGSFYAQLRYFAGEHGYKPGWVQHRYSEAVGAPPPYGFRMLEPEVSCYEVHSWVKSGLRRYGKLMRRGG